ncbi:MAG: hypothetical protein EKK52_10815 [Burkholderiales bacterium]|uniref:beta strand repeat-containing protein n=1 Tax=Roseateles sp. TaxID=1971397 RepID=UPI000F99501A|nr:MAG: hypothetical protein EKK52_10815 [Burkholderiales bacterium]
MMAQSSAQTCKHSSCQQHSRITQRPHNRLPRLNFVCLAIAALTPASAYSQTTFDFSSGWNAVAGSVTYSTSTFSTTSKGSPFQLIPPAGSGMYRLRPNNALTVDGAAAADVALGLTNGTVAGLLNNQPNSPGVVTNFAVLSKSMTLTAGSYSFAWALNVTDPGFNDGALFAVSGGGQQILQSLARAGGPGDTTGPSPNTYVAYTFDPNVGVTPWLTTTFTIATTGTYKVSFADYNWNDRLVDPNFFIATALGTYTGNPLAGTNAPPPTPDITPGTALGSALIAGNVNPVFDGGTLKADLPGQNYSSNIAIKGTGGSIDQGGLNSTFSGVLSDKVAGTSGALSIINSGTGGRVTLTGINTYTGATSIASGATLALSGAGSIAASSGLVNNGVFDISATTAGATLNSLTGGGSVALGAKTLTLANATGSFTGSISGSGSVGLTGGSQTLTGINTYTGATSVASGATLALSGAGSISASSGLVNNGVFDISATTAGATLNSLTGGGSVALGGKTLTLATATGSFTGSINGSGGVSITGGSQTLTGVQGYTGASSIASGATLALSGAGSIAASSGLLNNGVFDISATAAGATLNSLTGGGSVALGGKTLTLANATGSFTGSINGSGGIGITGGSQTLTGINTYTGATSVTSGATLALSGAGIISASSGLVNNGVFDISATAAGATLNSLTGGGSVGLGGKTLTLANATGSFSGPINGSGGVGITGGSQTLTGVQGYTGASSIASGATLALSGAGSIAASSGLLNNGVFDISATIAGATVNSLTGGGSVALGAKTLTLANATGIFSGSINGSGGVGITGGSQTLTGINTFTGTTSVGSGATLALSGAGSIAASSGLVNNGVFDISATTSGATLNSLTGGGNVALGGKTLTLANATGSFTGSINGSGGVSITGGSQTLTGSNTFTGTTSVPSGATLALSGAGSIAASSGLVNNGSLDISGTNQGSSLRTLAGAGNVSLGSKTLTIGAMVDTFAGTISGTGGVSINGGLWNLNNAQAFTGLTTVAAATLNLNGSLAGGVDLRSGAVLKGVGTISGPLTVGSGARLAPGNSPGVLTVNSSVSLASGSTLEIDINGPTPGNGAGRHDQLVLKGASSRFSAGGAQLTINLTGITGVTGAPYVPSLGQKFRIVSAEGGRDDTKFGDFAQPAGLDAGTRLRALYLPNSIDLIVVPTAYLAYAKGQGSNLNAQSVAAALDVMTKAQDNGKATAAQAALANAVVALDGPTLLDAMRGLSGEIHGAVATAVPTSGLRLENAVSRHSAVVSSLPQRGLWVDIEGGDTRWSASDTSSGARTQRSSQVVIGFDAFNDGQRLLGLALSQSQQRLRSDQGGDGTVDDTLAVLYGQFTIAKGLFVEGHVGGGSGKAKTTRDDPLMAPGQAQLTTSASTEQRFAGVGMRAPLNLGSTPVAPYARFDTRQIKRDATDEGAGALSSLSLDRFSANGKRIEVGVDVGSEGRAASTSRFTLGGRIAWGREGGSLSSATVSAKLAGTDIEIHAPRVERQYLRAELTGTWRLAPGSHVFAGLNTQSRTGRTDTAFSVGAVFALF